MVRVLIDGYQTTDNLVHLEKRVREMSQHSHVVRSVAVRVPTALVVPEVDPTALRESTFSDNFRHFQERKPSLSIEEPSFSYQKRASSPSWPVACIAESIAGSVSDLTESLSLNRMVLGLEGAFSIQNTSF